MSGEELFFCGIDGKIVDFGLSRLSAAESMNVYIGRSNSGPLKVLDSVIVSVIETNQWMSPEALSKRIYSTQSDGNFY